MGTGKTLLSLVVLFVFLTVGKMVVPDEFIWLGLVIIMAAYISRPDTVYVNQLADEGEADEEES